MIVQAEHGAAEVLRLCRVSKTFVSRGTRVDAVCDIDLRVGDGELVTIVGASGCGKSTLLNLMVGLQPATSGQVLFRGRPVDGPVPQLAYVTQKDTLLPWRTLQRNVEFPLEIRGIDRIARATRGRALIQQVGLGGFEDHYPHELSGGMRQRAMIVRSLVSDPEVLLLDEPFGALDAQTRGQLQDQLMTLQAATRKTMVFVTHDLMEAVTLADRVVVISSRPGRIIAEYEVPIPRPRSAFEVHRVPMFWKIFEAVKDRILGQPGSGGMIGQVRRDPDSVGVAERLQAVTVSEGADSRRVGWRIAAHVCFIGLVLGVWETISGSLVHSFWVSKPSLIAGTLAEWFAGRDFWRHFGITMTEVLNGFALGVVTGVLAGFVFGELPRIGKFLDPYMAALYGVPKTALAPLLILWFGIGLGAKVMLAAIMVFFLVFFNTAAGLRAVDPDLVNMARVAGASRAQILTKIKFPFAFPYVMTGIKVGLPTGLVGAIVAEFISSNQGIGYLIVRSSMFFDTAGVFAGVIVLAVTVFVLSELLSRIERYVLRWRPEAR